MVRLSFFAINSMRPRKNKSDLPPCMYLKHGAYWLVKKGKWERLGDSLPHALAAYWERKAKAEHAIYSGMGDLLDRTMELAKKRVAESTYKQYKVNERKVRDAFQEFRPDQITPKVVVDFRTMLADTPSMFNACYSMLKMAMDLAVEEGSVKVNPCLGVKRFKEAPRDRLITKEEFDAIKKHAAPVLATLMDIYYYSGQRVSDVIGITKAKVKEDGLHIRQSKTGARLIVTWTPQLKKAVEKYLRFEARSYWSIAKLWRNACAKSGIAETQLRDLRAMSGTHAEAQGLNPTALLGHTTEGMTRRYLRGRTAKVVTGPSFRQPVKSIRHTKQTQGSED